MLNEQELRNREQLGIMRRTDEQIWKRPWRRLNYEIREIGS